jgi:acetyl-CoA carboxylase biotin carboxyl carrier protein
METLHALIRSTEDRTTIASPKVGVFQRHLDQGDFVRPGSAIGLLRVLERRYRIVAPHGASGEVVQIEPHVSRPVGYGEVLLELGALTHQTSTAASAARASAPDVDAALVVRAPIHGIFYRRSAPGARAYVEPGDRVRHGQTVGLIEVMKTFNPVVYEGEAEARVVSIAVEDRSEIEAGAVLIVLG